MSVLDRLYSMKDSRTYRFVKWLVIVITWIKYSHSWLLDGVEKLSTYENLAASALIAPQRSNIQNVWIFDEYERMR